MMFHKNAYLSLAECYLKLDKKKRGFERVQKYASQMDFNPEISKGCLSKLCPN